jgi:NADH-quinone oxidoreductase subunit N
MNAIIALSIFGIINLFLGFLKNNKLVQYASIAFVMIAIGLNYLDWNHEYLWFNGMLKTNNNSINFSNLILIAGLLVIAISNNFGKESESNHAAEYYAIMLFSLVGACIMVSYENFIMLFVGIEILSVSMYVLTGSDKQNPKSNEAALKYFLMGAFFTGILLYGMVLMYGALGSLDLAQMKIAIDMVAQPGGGSMIYIGMIMLLIGLLFKISIAPFHFWTPDVYQGAPSIFTAFMSTVVKIAGFAALYKITSVTLSSPIPYKVWFVLMILLIVVTLLVSNISAVLQSNFKRVMAFSGISHAGYMLISLISKTPSSNSSLVFYGYSYVLSTVVAFAIFMLLSERELKDGQPNQEISVFNGLGKSSPLLAACLSISMLSMAGIPLTAGFWGKFFVFSNANERGTIWILIYAILMSAVSVYYYFKPIVAAYTQESTVTSPIQVNTITKIVVIIATIVLVVLGIAPDLLKNLV